MVMATPDAMWDSFIVKEVDDVRHFNEKKRCTAISFIIPYQ